MLVAIGTQISGLEHGFRDALTPGFIGGLLVLIGTQLTSLFVGAPKQAWDGTLRRGGDARAVDQAAIAKTASETKTALENK